ncbi:dioxygenase [Rhizoctonia solani]|uniref:Dioxygenase n=1 Tax=Rhizoctonia solani TaxID=456999 RepID=A0A8H7I7J6_9AGAM|nr:dioxygenase [Rhizoctonia solani]
MSAPAPSKAVAEAQKAGAPTVDLSTVSISLAYDEVRSFSVNPPYPRVCSGDKLTTEEWMAGIQFLQQRAKPAQISDRNLFFFPMSLGSLRLDAIDHPKVGNSTEATVLGPFFTEDAHDIQHGESIASENKGDYLYVSGKVVGSKGEPVANAIVYDTQYENRTEPDCRGRLRTGPNGEYAFRAVVPVAYPIPSDGPVGKLLAKLERHVYRPAHLHVKIQAEGYDTLITTVFPAVTRFKQGSKFKELEFDFVLVKKEDADAARKARAEASAAKI